MKLLILFFSLFLSLNNINLNNELKLSCHYEQIEKGKYNYGDYTIIEREVDLELLYKEQRLQLINSNNYYKVILEKDTISIFYKTKNNDYINVLKYKLGKLVYNKTINNKFVNNFDVIKNRDGYLLVTSIEEYENELIQNNYSNKQDTHLNRNGIILLLDDNINIIKCNILGGLLNDTFNKIYFDSYSEQVYISGYKDQNSGYDFGNGGKNGKGYIFLSIDEELNLLNYLICDETIENVEIDEKIHIFTKDCLFLVNSDLNYISSLKFPSGCIFGTPLTNNRVAIFYDSNLKIYDYKLNLLLTTHNYLFDKSISDVYVENGYLYFCNQDYLYKAVFYDNVYNDKTFIYDKICVNNKLELSDIKDELFGVPQNFKLKEMKYSVDYDRSRFGIYDLILDYEYFKVNAFVEILERCNVSNNNIYPVGYNILFSGQAFLNGEEIPSNYLIQEEGEYELVLKGYDEEIIINFYAYNMDITFLEDDIKVWDEEIHTNQEYCINLSYNDDIVIKKVFVNEEECLFNIDEEKNILSLKFKSDEVGLYKYTINYIVYEKDNNEYIKNIDYSFSLKVLQDKMNFNNSIYDKDDNIVFNAKINDIYNQLRYFKIIIDNNNENTIFIPIKEGSININKLNIKTESLMTIYAVYDVGGKKYEQQELIKLKYEFKNDEEIININLVKDETNQYLEEINIIFKEYDNIKEIINNNNTEYVYQNTKDYKYIIYSILIVVILFVSFKIIKTIKKKQNNEKY